MPTWKLTRVDRDVKIRWSVDKPAASVIRTGVPIREKRARNEHKDTLKRVEVIFIEVSSGCANKKFVGNVSCKLERALKWRDMARVEL